MSMSTTSSSHTYIVHLPARPDKLDGDGMYSIIENQLGRMVAGDAVLELQAREYLEQYPVVYIVHAGGDGRTRDALGGRYVVYVGETNDIVSRTRQHLTEDVKKRDDWRGLSMREDAQQYVIGSEFFNKSLTLDVENRLMHYMSSVGSVGKINNRRTNAQGKYFTHEKFNSIFHDIWLGLHQQDPMLFPAEQIIRDSALFKASPFHELSREQKEAERTILETLFSAHAATDDSEAADKPILILVGGAAGTGKTVLLSHLFYRIMTEGIQAESIEDDAEVAIPETERPSAYILVNHNEQRHVYNQIATKLGLQKRDDQVVLRPSNFIKWFSKHEDGKVKCIIGTDGKKRYIPEGAADIVLVDEAHLLNTQGNQGYSGANMLADILRRAKVVVAIFDPHQILESRQRWDDTIGAQLFSEINEEDRFEDGDIEDLPICYRHIRLRHQFRIAANDTTVQWLEDFTQCGKIGPLMKDKGKRNPQAKGRGDAEWVYKPYDLRVFDSPVELMNAIREKEVASQGSANDSSENRQGPSGEGLSRVLATYDWEYKDAGRNPDMEEFGGQWGVEMHWEDGQWRMGPAANHDRGIEANDDVYFFRPWNYQIPDTKEEKVVRRFSDLAWAEKPHTIEEIGSTFTIQGFDLNYAGVILGPSVRYNRQKGCIEFHSESSKSRRAVQRRDGTDYAVKNLRNELNVLMTRGVHGLYVFAYDPALRAELMKRQKERDQQ